MSLSGHQSAKMKNDEWLTPPEILRALGSFDLDPRAPIAFVSHALTKFRALPPMNTLKAHNTKLRDANDELKP